MSEQLSPVLRRDPGPMGEGHRLTFRCPACRSFHAIHIGAGRPPRWSWDGDAEKPTFSPSVKVTWPEPSDKPEEFEDRTKDREMCCHFMVKAGRIEFCGDCTHGLKGQTVDMVAFEAPSE